MKVKVSEATDNQINWMVAECEGCIGADGRLTDEYCDSLHHDQDGGFTTDWAQGGPIIEKGHPNYPSNRMEFRQGNVGFYASYRNGTTWWGKTYLIAAMRCYVASKLGDEVEVPEELK